MKKNLTIVGTVLMFAVGCASWHKDDTRSSDMNEPAGAERSTGASVSTPAGDASVSGSMRSTNHLDKSSSGSSSSSSDLNSSDSQIQHSNQSGDKQQQ